MPAIQKRNGAFINPTNYFTGDVIRNVRLNQIANRIRPRNAREPLIATLARCAAGLQDPVTGEPLTFQEFADRNKGTAATGVTATEYGDGYQHLTKLAFQQLTFPAIAGGADLAVGKLLYTLPAGAEMIDGVQMSIYLQDSENVTADTPDVGIGTVIGSGAVAVLGGTATFENILTGQTASDCDGTALSAGAGPTAGAPLFITRAGAHTVYLNIADGWAASGTSSLYATGEIWLSWKYMGSGDPYVVSS